MRNRNSSVVLALLGAALAGSVGAAIIPVTTANNLNTVIAGANPGDTLLLADGTYNQDVEISKNIIIQAANTGAATITGTSALGAVRTQAADITLTGINISGSSFVGISIESAGTLTMNNVQVTGNGVGGSNNDDRSGLFFNNVGGTLVLNTNTCSFSNNLGRGMTLSGGTFNVLDWTDLNSQVNGNAEVGVLADTYGTLDLTGTQFNANTGSGLTSFYAQTGTISGASFSNNGNRGLELLPVAGMVNNLTITSSSLNNNNAQNLIIDQAGGGTRPNQVVNATDCTFNGSASQQGVACFVGGTFTFTNCEINNSAAEGVARFFWGDPSGSTFTFDGTTVSGNGAHGVRLDPDAGEPVNVSITDSTFAGNGGEGPLQIFGGNGTVSISQSSFEIGTGGLGALVIFNKTTSNISNTLIDAGGQVGLFVTATDGDAGANTVNLDFCTVVGNGALGKQGLLLRTDSPVNNSNITVNANNSIIAGFDFGVNYDEIAGLGVATKGGDYSLYFNTVDFDDGAANTNDIVAQNPLFVGSGNYSLGTGSPAIDTADPASIVVVDITGAVRPQGAGRDRGAYEGAAASLSEWLMYN